MICIDFANGKHLCLGSVLVQRETETDLTEMKMDVLHDLIKHKDAVVGGSLTNLSHYFQITKLEKSIHSERVSKSVVFL